MKFEFKGIIRQIEDTGRIEIPKEMRNTLKVKAGDKMEMCIFGDVLCLKKVKEEKTKFPTTAGVLIIFLAFTAHRILYEKVRLVSYFGVNMK